MIESEETRKEITEDIKRWCDHVKATPLLRQRDIPSLVYTILEEFFHIRLCCGHLVRDFDEGVNLAFNDFITDRSDMEHGGGIGGVTGSYCKDCAKRLKKELVAWEIDAPQSKTRGIKGESNGNLG